MVRMHLLLGAGFAGAVAAAGMARADAITIPNFDFSVGTYNNTSPLIPNAPSGTVVGPQVASFSGWQVTFNPMTFNGGTYNNYTPTVTVWNNGWYGSGAEGQPAFLGVFGGEPNAGYYWTGGSTNPVTHDRFLLTGESAVLTSTGITATTVAGATYTATMAVGGSSWQNLSWVDAVKPTYTINLLVDGAVVSSNTVANPAYNVWTDISTSYVAPTAGKSIQIQMVADNITAANWGPFSTGSPTFSDARLTEVVPEPAVLSLLGLASCGMLLRRRK